MKFNSLYFKKYKDQFNIYNLIKQINPNYRLYFNNKNKRFAIVNICNNFEICKEFDRFFGNILQDLRFSKVENSKIIFKNIDEFNQKLLKQNQEKQLEQTNYLTKEISKISNRSNTITKPDINKIIGETKC